MGSFQWLHPLGQPSSYCGRALCPSWCLPSPSNSTATKVMYGLMLLVAVFLSSIAVAPGLQSFLQKAPFCDNYQSNSLTKYSVHNMSGIMKDCKQAVGYMVVYRICFAVFIFFALMSLLMMGVKNSRDGRAPVQNEFWILKYIVVFAGMACSVFIIPASLSYIWMICGMIGGFIYLILQFIQVLDFAHSVSESWFDKMEQAEDKRWYFVLLFTTLVIYGLAIIGIVFMFQSFTQGIECGLNIFFIALTIIICLFISYTSISSCVQRIQKKSGLLKSSIVSLYLVYLNWSALSSSPEGKCNKSFIEIVQGKSYEDGSKIHFSSENLVSTSIFVLFVIYSALKTESSSTLPMSVSTERSNNSNFEEEQISGNDDNSGNNINPEGEQISENDDDTVKFFDDEKESVAYSWSFYHFRFAMATLFLMMTLTNWYSPNSNLKNFHSNYASTWIKILSCWVCAALYAWTLLGPILLPLTPLNQGRSTFWEDWALLSQYKL